MRLDARDFNARIRAHTHIADSRDTKRRSEKARGEEQKTRGIEEEALKFPIRHSCYVEANRILIWRRWVWLR